MSCPWADIQKPHPVNLQDIISEAKREKKCPGESNRPKSPPGDEQVARMPQEENDEELESERQPPSADYDSEEDMDSLERKAWDEFDALDREEALMPSFNSLSQEGKVNKFKEIMDEIRNAGKNVLFTPDYKSSPDYHHFKQFYKLFKSSTRYSFDVRQKNPKFDDKSDDYEFKIDGYTCNLLYKLICNKTLRKVNGIIGAGEESIVLHADAEQNYPEKYAIKVFRNDTQGFNDKVEKSTACRTALREMRNLLKLREAEIPCPRVVTIKKHLLVMSFIGDNFKSAPSLLEVSGDFDQIYHQVINILKTMYRETNLIYSELSLENILWYKNQCYLIDVSQAVDLSHEDAFHFLYWGCSNVTKFFLKKDVKTMLPEELFEFITGIEHEQKLSQLEVQKSILSNKTN